MHGRSLAPHEDAGAERSEVVVRHRPVGLDELPALLPVQRRPLADIDVLHDEPMALEHRAELTAAESVAAVDQRGASVDLQEVERARDLARVHPVIDEVDDVVPCSAGPGDPPQGLQRIIDTVDVFQQGDGDDEIRFAVGEAEVVDGLDAVEQPFGADAVAIAGGELPEIESPEILEHRCCGDGGDGR